VKTNGVKMNLVTCIHEIFEVDTQCSQQHLLILGCSYCIQKNQVVQKCAEVRQ